MASQPKLPCLPGYSFNTQHKDKHYRHQHFNVVNGVMVTERSPNKSVPPHLINSNISFDGDLKQQETKNSGLGYESSKPSWVEYDGVAANFAAFFKEPVEASPIEAHRIRQCRITFFLEDGSMTVSEPKVDNSGIVQGTFIKRHRIPKGKNSYFELTDLKIGADVTMYGRTFHIINCDQATRDVFAKHQLDLGGEPEDLPEDSFSKLSKAKKAKGKTRKPNPEVEATTKFLKNDNKVLRFYGTWQDNSMYGEKRKYTVCFYLSDDTVEVIEVVPYNSGRDSFPTLLKRTRLPKAYRESVASVATIGVKDNNSNFYSEDDLKIGKEINVFGRNILLTGCDSWTKEWYKANRQMDESEFASIDVEEAKPQPKPQEIPPYNGFGTEEDSLGSFKYLVPRAPKKDFQKILAKEGEHLRFVAKFANPSGDDADRSFVVTFYMGDETISIFERMVRNSGFVGGKFLERSKVKKPDGSFYQPSDLYVDAIINVNGHKFVMTDADQFTRKYQDSNSNVFSNNVVA